MKHVSQKGAPFESEDEFAKQSDAQALRHRRARRTLMSDKSVEEAATELVTEWLNVARVVVAAVGNRNRPAGIPTVASDILSAASYRLGRQAAALGDPAWVEARAEALRAELAQITDPAAAERQRMVLARAAERLREAATAAHNTEASDAVNDAISQPCGGHDVSQQGEPT